MTYTATDVIIKALSQYHPNLDKKRIELMAKNIVDALAKHYFYKRIKADPKSKQIDGTLHGRRKHRFTDTASD